MRLPNVTIGQRLVCINGLLGAAIVVVCLLAFRTMGQLEFSTESMHTLSLAKSYSQDVDTMHYGLRCDLLGELLSSESAGSSRETLRRNASNLRRDLEALSALKLDKELHSSVSETSAVASAYVDTVTSIAEDASQNREEALARLPELDQSFEAVLEALAAQTKLLGNRIDESDQHSQTMSGAARRWLIVAGVLVNLFVALLVTLISRSIRGSLRRVAQTAERIASGDLGARGEIATRDEVGQLAQHLNTMASSLGKMMEQSRVETKRSVFGTQLTEALEMADDEPGAHAVIARAMQMISSDHPTELLLSDSSRAHLEVAAEHPTAGGPGCNVESPFACVAVRRGNPVIFPDSDALNACPRLRGRPSGPVCAVCVPVSFMGRALGVLHTATKTDERYAAEEIAQLTTLGIQAGARIGTVRAFQRTQVQASTDGLTGLANRRSLETFARNMIRESRSFSFVLADLDHFKNLNDSQGHQAGDAALRLFSEVARKAVRDLDLVARWGGEEFAFILMDANEQDALAWVERMRLRLVQACAAGTTPVFTASFGIAGSRMAGTLEELVRIADQALYQSKDGGRDQGTIGDPKQAISGEGGARHASEQKSAPSRGMMAEDD